jgi:HTH-type transcriptional regulator/antitoxin MqsA
MKCPTCGGAELVRECKTVTRLYKGVEATVPDVCGEFCPACGEIVFDGPNGDRYMALLRCKAVDGGD